MNSIFSRHAVAHASLCLIATLGSGQASAQTRESRALAPVTITGNPLGATELIAPSVQLTGTNLLLRSQSTWGETLDGTPGISSTYFGPNASRPIIRGLDGDRIRILQNSGSTLDASGLSFDHAVPGDPISVERIEVLRGPGALMYGGSAVGGVVNMIDNRIPRSPLFDAKGGISGRADLGWASANQERAGALLLEGGSEKYAMHADVYGRTAGDVAVPVALACAQTGAPALQNRICNSAANARGGALGGSVFFQNGFVGASASSHTSDYGTVAEDEVTIGMQSRRFAIEGEVRALGGWFQSINAQASRSDYQHTEFEAGAPGTVFKNAGTELRVVARHRPVAGFDGVVGLQLDRSEFSADGAEAFAPFSRTLQNAVFVYEEKATGFGKFSLGARVESVTVESLGNAQVARFVAGSNRFTPASLALGALWNLSPAWQLTGNLAYTERAPKDYELYADGPHLATGAYEVGNAGFSNEKSTMLDLGVQWKSGAHNFSLNAFVNQFDNYILQSATGINRDTEGNGGQGVGVTDSGNGDNTSLESGGAAQILPEFVYRAVAARFTGLEASANLRLLQGPATLDLVLRADQVRAIETATGQNLPRIAPLRLGATLQWARGPWGARAGASHVAAQDQVAPGQPSTSAYTLVNAAITYRQAIGAVDALWFAKMDNAGDVLAYSSTSILTQTVPGKAPLPGRNLRVGLRLAF